MLAARKLNHLFQEGRSGRILGSRGLLLGTEQEQVHSHRSASPTITAWTLVVTFIQ